ncbi:MAG: DUF3108 domain-containing protein [Nitrospiraceae bacterium]|nr:MAG: DUF3108 domain-containing protein [Nitrospiraceae bacterium]
MRGYLPAAPSQVNRTTVLCLFLLFCLLVSAAPHASGAAPTVNKTFVYYIYWTGIRAGQAVLNYESTPEGIAIRTHATSADWLSLFYKVDDRAESILYPDGYPRKFSLHVRQGRHKREKVTYFERNTEGPQKITYHNILDDERLEYLFDTPAYDPLSAFYEMTRWDLREGRSFYINIFDTKKLWNTEVRVLGRETIRVDAGEFNTIVVKPILKSEGIFPKTGDITIWATDDDRKLPVLVKSKATIGYFKAVLVEGDL